jgi:hypothetical protein
VQVGEWSPGVFFSVSVRLVQSELFLVPLPRRGQISHVYRAIVHNEERRLTPHLCALIFNLFVCLCDSVFLLPGILNQMVEVP